MLSDILKLWFTLEAGIKVFHKTATWPPPGGRILADLWHTQQQQRLVTTRGRVSPAFPVRRSMTGDLYYSDPDMPGISEALATIRRRD